MAAANPLPDLQPFPQGRGAPAPPRACVVNDDEPVLGSLKFLFAAAGFEVRAFQSGRGLLASPSLRAADCFVLDHKPRGADGLHLARRLRGLGLDAPIVLTLGFRCSALESVAQAVERVIPAARVDEDLIRRLLGLIHDARGSRIRETT